MLRCLLTSKHERKLQAQEMRYFRNGMEPSQEHEYPHEDARIDPEDVFINTRS